MQKDEKQDIVQDAVADQDDTGRNGTGKSTLLNIIAKKNRPDEGSVETADGLKIVVFDQHREKLDQGQTLRRALSPYGDSVVYRDRSVHVVTWAKKFLFRFNHLR